MVGPKFRQAIAYGYQELIDGIYQELHISICHFVGQGMQGAVSVRRRTHQQLHLFPGFVSTNPVSHHRRGQRSWFGKSYGEASLPYCSLGCGDSKQAGDPPAFELVAVFG